MKREFVGQFSLPACPEVLEQTWPGLNAGPTKNAIELRTQVAVAIPVAIDYEISTIGGQFITVFEKGNSLGNSGTTRRGFPCLLVLGAVTVNR